MPEPIIYFFNGERNVIILSERGKMKKFSEGRYKEEEKKIRICGKEYNIIGFCTLEDLLGKIKIEDPGIEIRRRIPELDKRYFEIEGFPKEILEVLRYIFRFFYKVEGRQRNENVSVLKKLDDLEREYMDKISKTSFFEILRRHPKFLYDGKVYVLDGGSLRKASSNVMKELKKDIEEYLFSLRMLDKIQEVREKIFQEIEDYEFYDIVLKNKKKGELRIPVAKLFSGEGREYLFVGVKKDKGFHFFVEVPNCVVRSGENFYSLGRKVFMIKMNTMGYLEPYNIGDSFLIKAEGERRHPHEFSWGKICLGNKGLSFQDTLHVIERTKEDKKAFLRCISKMLQISISYLRGNEVVSPESSGVKIDPKKGLRIMEDITNLYDKIDRMLENTEGG